MQQKPNAVVQEESHLKVLRLLEQDPNLSQRELAEVLGISVGKTNYCIKALVDKGLLKINNFRTHKHKRAYAYLLTPAGIAKKTELTMRFLHRKIQEYDALQTEIALLQADLQATKEKTC